MNDEIDELQKKKRCLQTDIDLLTTSGDEYAEKAEQTHQVSWITKSISFRRSAKKKSAEVTAVNSCSRSCRSSRATNEVVLDSLL